MLYIKVVMIRGPFNLKQFLQKQQLPTLMRLSVIAIWTTIAVTAQACDSYRQIDHSTCVFYADYSSADGSCGGFQFQLCTWVDCVRYVSSGRSTYCAQYQSFSSTNWDMCTYRCCNSEVIYPKSASSLQECQDYLDQTYKSSVIIIIAVAASVGGVVLLCCLSFCCCCSESCADCCTTCREFMGDCRELLLELVTCQCFRDEEQGVAQEQEAPRGNTNLNLAKPGLEEQITETKLVWEEDKQFNFADVCSVCLDGHPSLQLQCGHIYHRQCIIECMKRKRECILCRSTQFNHVRVYCEQCYSSYYSTTLLQHSLWLSSNRQICQACKSPTFDI